MSSPPLIEPVRNCHNCGQDVPLGALACEKCHALLYSEDLARISTRAKSLEEESDFAQARQEWMKALPLLPGNSTQAEWIKDKISKLELAAKSALPESPKHA